MPNAKVVAPLMLAGALAGCGGVGTQVEPPIEYSVKPAEITERCYMQDQATMERTGLALIESGQQFYFHVGCQHHQYQAELDMPGANSSGTAGASKTNTDGNGSDGTNGMNGAEGSAGSTNKDGSGLTGADGSAGTTNKDGSGQNGDSGLLNIDPDTGLPYCDPTKPEPIQTGKMPPCVYKY